MSAGDVFNFDEQMSFEVLPKKAFSIGSLIQFPLSKKWSINTGLYYTQKSFDIDYSLTLREGFRIKETLVNGIKTTPYQTLTLPIEGLYFIHSENIPTFALFLKMGYRLDYIFKQDKATYDATPYQNQQRGVKQSYNTLKTLDHGMSLGLGLDKGIGEKGTLQFSLAYNFLFTKSVHFDLRTVTAPIGSTTYTEQSGNIYMDRGNTLIRMELAYLYAF